LLHHQTAVKNFYDETKSRQSIILNASAIKEATGATRVVAFDHIVRNAAMAALEGSCIKILAKRVHNDYTA
jgi:hypothetical protein